MPQDVRCGPPPRPLPHRGSALPRPHVHEGGMQTPDRDVCCKCGFPGLVGVKFGKDAGLGVEPLRDARGQDACIHSAVSETMWICSVGLHMLTDGYAAVQDQDVLEAKLTLACIHCSHLSSGRWMSKCSMSKTRTPRTSWSLACAIVFPG